jgi:beta-lactamase regulating signal transducer with metallopeptidase domain
MSDILRIIISLSISGSFMAFLLLICKPVITKHMSKACYYYIWILVLLRLVIPFSFHQNITNQMFNSIWSNSYTKNVLITNNAVERDNTEPISNSKNADEIVTVDKSQQSIKENDHRNTPVKNNEKKSVQVIFTMIWLAGSCVTLILCVIPYIQLKLKIKETNMDPDQEDIDVLHNLFSRKKIGLKYNSYIGTPMLIGIISPCIVLPGGYYVKNGRKQELENIVYHELMHYKRKDLIYKWFTVVVTSFHWFNPLMLPIRHQISRSCELSCDEAVIRNMSVIQKQSYGETLLSMAAGKRLYAGILATTLCEERKELEERLIGIMKHKKQTSGMLLFSIAIMVLLTGCGTILGSATNGKVLDTSAQSGSSKNNLETPKNTDDMKGDGKGSPSQSTSEMDITPSPKLDKIDIEKIENVIEDNTTFLYEGKIGTQNGYLVIYRDGESLTASYFTQNDEDGEVNLQGTIQTNTASFVLNSDDGNVTFKGTIKPGKTIDDLDLLEGTYTSSLNGEDTKFKLNPVQSIGGNTYETRYPLCASNTKDIEEFASKIKLYVTESNKTGLAELIDYPINVIINGSKVSINNKEEFKQKYDDIINAEYKEAIKKSHTKYLFANYAGIMMGNGEIWFDVRNDTGLRIFAINN